MKCATAFSVALFAVVASAASLDVGSVISSFYPTSTPQIPAGASTSLASALFSVQATWTAGAAFTSAEQAIFSAAPASVQSSISKSGYEYRDITSQTWYTKNVPAAVQTAVAAEISAIDSAANSVFAQVTETSKGAAAPKQTAMAGAVAGVVGIVGLLAAL